VRSSIEERTLPVPLVYSSKYHVDFGQHVFPVEKYGMVARALKDVHGWPEKFFHEPAPATIEQLRRVHSELYLEDLRECQWNERTAFSELPISKPIVDMFVLACGGTIRAAELALAHGCAVHIGGGFHHAFAEKAEGFCYLNDLAVAARAIQVEKGLQRIMIIDLDLHQGNGTAGIFRDDDSVFTFSMHQRDLYPIKQESNVDIHLRNGVSDEEYLRQMTLHVPALVDDFKPEVILYQAGADPFEKDQLGDLKLTIEGLAQRDRLIYRWAAERKIPIAVTLGGGYAYETKDTVTIHVNTCLTADEIWREKI
jgi:acetoin utilization deacetylase AcuC-like enzyme